MTHSSDPYRTGELFANNGTYEGPGALTSPIFVRDFVPAAIGLTSVAAAQAVAGAANLTLNGTLVTAGVATNDFARAISILSTDAVDTTQIATVYGTDTYGIAMREAITFNGTTRVTGKKAFKTVTRVAISAVMTGNASVGNSDVFGITYRVDSRNYVQTAYNGAQVTTGTLVVADTATATATTGDVRGTYLVPSASDGSKRLTMWIFVKDPNTLTGLMGVTQYNG